ncbi:MAG TPA: fibronectin type III domain-containing protein, partial [Panacibacter sp.]|nr:fibronectin type III domain-containing protein [Panacibacter sp.]
WYHIAFVRNNGTMRAYVNGVQAPNISNINPNLPTSFRIGSENGVRFFNGKVDEIRLWSIARTQAEIQADMSGSVCGDQIGLISYYSFNQGIAGGNNANETTLYDITSNNNDGALNNFALTGAASNWVTGVPGISDCNSCAPPSNLKVVKVTGGSAKIKWTLPASPVKAFVVRYRPVGTSDWNKKTISKTSSHTLLKGLPANTTYNWRMSSLCSEGEFNWVAGPDFTTEGVLPVTITNLKAYRDNGSIKIAWTGVTEINLSAYEIQRSSDVEGFGTIGKIAAKSKGALQQDYSFSDLRPMKGNNYYRIKANNIDGTSNYSNTVLINLSNSNAITMVYPVPAKDILHIETNDNTSFSILDQSGKVLLTQIINGKGSINIAAIASGMYYLKNNNTGGVQKVMISK